MGGEVADTDFRLTVLTHEVLAAVANLGGQGSNPSNREIAQAAGVKDEGQISKLLARLQSHSLLNTGGHTATNALAINPARRRTPIRKPSGQTGRAGPHNNRGAFVPPHFKRRDNRCSKQYVNT